MQPAAGASPAAAGGLSPGAALPTGTKKTATRSPAAPGASTTGGASSPWKSVVAVGSLLGWQRGGSSELLKHGSGKRTQAHLK